MAYVAYEIPNYDYVKAKLAEVSANDPAVPWSAYPCLLWDRPDGRLWNGERYLTLAQTALEIIGRPVPTGFYIRRECLRNNCFMPAHLKAAPREVTWTCRVCAKPCTGKRRKYCSRECAVAERDLNGNFQHLKDLLATLDDDQSLPWSVFPCLEWDRGRDFADYGRVWIDGRDYPCHRVAYGLAVGPIPDHLHACHHCDNPPCIRPVHIFPGTLAENMRDRDMKGRGADHGGVKNGRAKRTDEEIVTILRLYAQGARTTDLAKQFEMSRGAMGHIVHRRHWKHVNP